MVFFSFPVSARYHNGFYYDFAGTDPLRGIVRLASISPASGPKRKGKVGVTKAVGTSTLKTVQRVRTEFPETEMNTRYRGG